MIERDDLDGVDAIVDELYENSDGEELASILRDVDVTPKTLIENVKALSKTADNEATKLRASEMLMKLAGVFDKSKDEEESIVKIVFKDPGTNLEKDFLNFINPGR